MFTVCSGSDGPYLSTSWAVASAIAHRLIEERGKVCADIWYGSKHLSRHVRVGITPTAKLRPLVRGEEANARDMDECGRLIELIACPVCSDWMSRDDAACGACLEISRGLKPGDYGEWRLTPEEAARLGQEREVRMSIEGSHSRHFEELCVVPAADESPEALAARMTAWVGGVQA